MIGNGLRLAAKPDPSAFGNDPASANEWAQVTESRFEVWAKSKEECDASGQRNLALQADAALRSYFGAGEILGMLPWIDREGATTHTKIRLLPAYRLTQDTNGVDLWQGVRVDTHGRPTNYRLRLTQPLMQVGQVVEVPARDNAGRPKVFHIFGGDIGVYRGISPLTPVLEVLRQFDQLQGSTLRASLIQALLAVTVKSPAPTADILAALAPSSGQGVGGAIDDWNDARADWYDGVNFDMSGLVGVRHLFPGEELDLNRTETPNQTYEAFAKSLLREIAR